MPWRWWERYETDFNWAVRPHIAGGNRTVQHLQARCPRCGGYVCVVKFKDAYTDEAKVVKAGCYYCRDEELNSPPCKC